MHARLVILFTLHQGRVSWSHLVAMPPTCKHPQQEIVELACFLEVMQEQKHARHASVVTILLSVQISYGARVIAQMVYVHVLSAKLSIWD